MSEVPEFAVDPWLGPLPVGWAIKRLGALGELIKGRGGSKEDNRDVGVPVVRYGDLYTKFDTTIVEPAAFISEEDAAKYTSLPKHSLVFAASGESAEDIGKSALSLLAEPAVVGGDAVVFRPGDDIDPLYLAYTLESTPMRSYKAIRSTGFTVVHISAGKLKTLPIPCPPRSAQRVIADYLDRETARIDTLIEEQQRLIEMLRERRTAVVEEAAAAVQTKGQRLKHIIRSVRQGWSPQCYPWPADGIKTWAVLKTGAANGGAFRPTENKELPETEVPRPEIVVRRGDLIVSRANTRDLVGSAAVVDGDFPRLMLCDKLYAFTLDETQALPRFIATVLGSRRWRDMIELEATGASYSMLNVSQSDIVNLPMPLPTLDDQRQILSRLDKQTAKIDELITETERFIDLARERRAALITAAVTGQIDVREMA